MALDQAANFVREDVTSAISAGDTTINVADASPFPVPPEGYNIVVWDGAAYVRPDQDPDVEIMRVTDTDTTNDTLTVARGQEGTSDFNHPDTSVVVVAQTAKMIADIASEKISNPVTETINVDGNDVTNVGALDAEQIKTTTRSWTEFTTGSGNQREQETTYTAPDYDIEITIVFTIDSQPAGNSFINIQGSVPSGGLLQAPDADRISLEGITIPANAEYEVFVGSGTSIDYWIELR